jgi:hypothetical protein
MRKLLILVSVLLLFTGCVTDAEYEKVAKAKLTKYKIVKGNVSSTHGYRYYALDTVTGSLYGVVFTFDVQDVLELKYITTVK